MSARTLRIPRQEARQLLQRQIDKGNELVFRKINSEEELSRYVDDRKRYNQGNVRMLERMFGEVVDAFWRFGISYPPEWEDFDFRVAFYKKWNSDEVNELKGIEESLDLIPKARESSSDKSQREPSRSWSRTEKIGIASLILTIIGIVVALIAIPEFRDFVGNHVSPSQKLAPSQNSPSIPQRGP